MSEDIKAKIINLTKQLNQWNYEYYALDAPSVSDATYDTNMRELIALEKQYPQYKQIDSPTARVGGIVLDKFNKIKHSRPMLSLDNIFDYEGLNKFINDIEKNVGKNNNLEYVIEPKIDGLSISIVYENCKLKYACTRGDGEYGEDVTSNVLTIKQIPLYINEKYKEQIIEVRGEVYMSLDALKELNENSDKQFANARNAAAGALRNLDSSITSSRKLQAFFYYAFDNKQNNMFQTQYETIQWLRENKFPIAPNIKKCCNLDEIWEWINHINYQRDNLPFDIDGAVIKLNQKKYYDEVGYTSKFPKWATAYKFPPKILDTKLIEIKTDVGRTGKINFIASLEPVILNGSTISAATLHNLDFIKERDIHLNDYVNIYKAGDVIPYVESVNFNRRDQNNIKEYHFDYLCPSCKQKVVNFDNNVDYYCLNPHCDEKNIRIIEYFVSKDIMNIDGISYSIIKKLYEKAFVKNPWDLYSLHKSKDLIINAQLQIKDKLFNKIINAIEQSKQNSLERLIASFNIKNVGINVATIIAKKFQNIDNLMNTTFDELIKIEIVGEKIAQNIIDFINDIDNVKMIQQIKELGINTQYLNDIVLPNSDQYMQKANDPLNLIYKEKNVVITGSFSIPRDEIKKILEAFYHCKVQTSVSKKTDYVLVGNDSGSKLDKAKELNIKIVTDEFWH